MDTSIAEITPDRHDDQAAPCGQHRTHQLLYFLDVAVLITSAAIFSYLLDLDGGLFGRLKDSGAVVLAAAAYSVFGFSSGLYDWRLYHRHLRYPFITLGAVVFAFGTLLLAAFALKISADFSRLWIGLWFLAFLLYVIVSRVVLTAHLAASKGGRPRRRAVILGAGDSGRDVLDHLTRFDDQGIQVLGFLDDRSDRLAKSYRGVPLLGGTQLAERLVRDAGVNLIIMALPWAAQARIDAIIRSLSHCAVDIYLAPDKLGLDYADRPVYRVGGMNVLSLRDCPIGDWGAVVKRVEDLSIAIPAVILLAPVMAIIALAIRLESKGKILFVQERYGFHNNLIRVYKFRSMYAEMTDANAERLAVKDDPRITRVGHFIRRTSLDELPQLFNVIDGSMSIVGPRPHATRAKAGDVLYQDAVAEYASRHRVKPGMTGWAQCNGWRGETDTREKIEKRVEHDLYYIENWSVFLDLLTIAKTLVLLFKKEESAY